MPALHPSAAVLVLHAWVEDHPTAPLRAVVTEVDPQGQGQVSRTASCSVDEVCAIVRSWLEGLLGDHRGGR